MTAVPRVIPLSGERIGVVGAGATGRAIAAAFARAGARVAVFDPDPDGLAVVSYRVALDLDAIGADPAAAANLIPVDTVAAAATADLVFEAAPEEPGLKRRLCAQLGLLARAEAIVVSVSKSLGLAEVVADSPRPGRLLAIHWWEANAGEGLVEVIEGEETEPAAAERLIRLLEATGKTTIRLGPEVHRVTGDRLVPSRGKE